MTEELKYEWREIGETDWVECDEAWFDYCNKSPIHDARIKGAEEENEV